jgi:branched-chain amino acid aminotransferase
VEAMVYLNGSVIPQSQARISPLDYGFLYGYGLFETMRAYSGHVFRLEKHLARLERSARMLNIDLDSAVRLEEAVYETLRANHLSDARIRLTVSPGEEEPSPNVPATGRPTVFVTARDYQPPSEQVYRRGLTATVTRVRRSPLAPSSKLKSLSSLDLLLARQAAAFDGVDHAILLNDDGLVTEGGSSNVFCAKGGTLFTPAEHCGVLPGITRDIVLRELAPSLAVAVAEVDMALADLVEADEAFLTNSMFEIMPLTNVADWPIGSGRPGDLTLGLVKAYKALVEQSLSRQGRKGAT